MTSRSVVVVLGLGVLCGLACSSGEENPSSSPGATAGASGKAGSDAGNGGSSGAGQGGSSAGSTAQGGNGGTGQAGAGAGGVSGTSGQSGAAGSGEGGSGASGEAGQGGEAGSGGQGGDGGSGQGGQAAGNGGAGAGQAGEGGAGSGAGAGQGGGGSGGAACVPTEDKETQCNGLDDDCNGKIDDVDVGNDGLCDCLRIGIIGIPGANNSSNFQTWLTEQGTSVERVHKTAEEVLDGALLGKFDVVILDRLVRPYTAPEADVLRVWVEGGGGFVSMTGYTGQPAPDFYPNALLSPFGLSYGGALTSATADTFFPHPVTQGISSITFLGGYVVSESPVDGGKSVAFAANSVGTVGVAHERGKGRGIAWGDEWIEFDSEWQNLPQIKLFWSNMLGWVGPKETCQIVKP